MTKCFNQRDETRKRDNYSGYKTLKYNITNRKEIMVDGSKATVLNIELHCDKKSTPWCECDAKSADLPKQGKKRN